MQVIKNLVNDINIKAQQNEDEFLKLFINLDGEQPFALELDDENKLYLHFTLEGELCKVPFVDYPISFVTNVLYHLSQKIFENK